MRSSILNVLACFVGLAAIVASAPALAPALSSDNVDVCDAITTVFITVSQPVTITIHDASTNTVHLSSPTGALPTTTITRHSTIRSTTTVAPVDTIYLTRSSSDVVQAAVSIPVSYDTTVYDTVTATLHQAGQSSSLLAFIVENGTTFWLGGNTPVATKSYIFATSVVTIQPINTAAGTTYLTTTLTIHSTRYTTLPQTVTRTLSNFNSSTTQTSGTQVVSSFGTAPASIQTSTTWGGWNATSTAGGVASTAGGVASTASGVASKSQVSFITQETVDIYKTTSFSLVVPSYTAQGGFDVLTTPSTFSASPNSTSAADGARTTATIDSQTVSLNAHGVNQTSTESSTLAPYTNTTSNTHSIASAGPVSTSSAQGAWTTTVVDGQTVSWNGNGTTSTCTESSNHVSYPNTTSASLQQSTNSAAGIITSSAHPTSLPPTAKASFSSSSKWYIYTPAASSRTAVLGDVTSASSNSTSSSVQAVSASNSTSLFSSPSTVVASSHMGTFTTASGPAADSTILFSSPSTVVAIPPMGTSTTATSPASDSTSLFSSTSTVVASSHMGTFATASTSSFLTLVSSAADSGNATNTVSAPSAASSAASTPNNCGETGDFVLNFDDIPPLSISNDSTFGQAQPIFSPYHHFDFSRGFTVGPPPVDPYLPESKPLLLEFTPSMNPDVNDGSSGSIGNVDHGLTACFSFNFYGASFGCDSEGPGCDFSFTGYRYDAASQSTKPVVSQQKTVSACPNLKSLDCILTPVTLDSSFENLDSVSIGVTVQGVPKIWWMDDVRLGWFNNTCENGMCRAKSPVRGITLLPLKI